MADTPEYIEGTGYPIPPEIITQLHRGHFALQLVTIHIHYHMIKPEAATPVSTGVLHGNNKSES